VGESWVLLLVHLCKSFPTILKFSDYLVERRFVTLTSDGGSSVRNF